MSTSIPSNECDSRESASGAFEGCESPFLAQGNESNGSRTTGSRGPDPNHDAGAVAYGKVCICGQSEECKGISSAFALLNDRRRGFVRLPNLVVNPETKSDREQNGLRTAYLRHLTKGSALIDLIQDEEDEAHSSAHYVALHHFHPTVVEAHATKKKSNGPVPKTLKPIDLNFLQLNGKITEEDRVLDDNGKIMNSYYFVPCYPLSKAKNDLMRSIRITRMVKEAKSQATRAKSPQKVQQETIQQETREATPIIPSATSYESVESADTAQQNTNLPFMSRPDNDEVDRLRKIQYNAMLKFETRRRAKYASERDEYAMRWKAALEMLQAGIFECARAERLLLASVMANRAYGEALRLIYDDSFLDDEGNVVTSASVQSRLKKTRFEEEYSIESDGWSPQKQALPDAPERRSTLLNSLILSQSKLANCFSEHGEIVISQIIPEITSIRREIKRVALELRGFGDALLREMTEAENEVQDAWVGYDAIAGLSSDQEKLAPTMTFDLEKISQVSADSGNEHNTSSMVLIAGHGYEPMGRRSTPQEDFPLPSIVIDEDLTPPTTPKRSENEISVDMDSPAMLNHSLSSFSGGHPDFHSLAMSSGGRSPRKELGQSPLSGLFRRSTEVSPKSSTVGRGGFLRMPERHAVDNTLPEAGVNSIDTSMENSPYRPVSSSAATVLKSMAEIKDTWMKEMVYRSAVDFTAQVWEQCIGELNEMLKTMQNIEAQRRMKVHQEILDFLPRERRLFSGLPAIMQSVTPDLVGLRVFSEFSSDIIDDTIRRHSEKLVKDEPRRQSKIMNRSGGMPDLDELLDTLPGEFFDNGLLEHAKVVDRRTGLMGTWRTTLIVITADKNLHLFDCTPFENIERGTWAENAFKELLPRYELPTMATWEPVPREEALLKHLIPLASINLSNVIALQDSNDPQVMDILEVVFGLFRSRKFTFKTTGREETNRLIEIIMEYSGTRQDMDQQEAMGQPKEGPDNKPEELKDEMEIEIEFEIVEHKDGDAHDNKGTNLVLGTPKENDENLGEPTVPASETTNETIERNGPIGRIDPGGPFPYSKVELAATGSGHGDHHPEQALPQALPCTRINI